mmetsp:Transcript_10565/g.43108  ORF Transcript_10565/g.43108 Transcript_10565/m.43108 type:complete len:200 (-) Transcript_10565:2991-3590(-)
MDGKPLLTSGTGGRGVGGGRLVPEGVELKEGCFEGVGDDAKATLGLGESVDDCEGNAEREAVRVFELETVGDGVRVEDGGEDCVVESETVGVGVGVVVGTTVIVLEGLVVFEGDGTDEVVAVGVGVADGVVEELAVVVGVGVVEGGRANGNGLEATTGLQKNGSSNVIVTVPTGPTTTMSSKVATPSVPVATVAAVWRV